MKGTKYTDLEKGEPEQLTTKEIKESKNYDPLVHLNEAKEKGVDLTDFY